MKQSTEYKDLSKGLDTWQRQVLTYCLGKLRSKIIEDQAIALTALFCLSKEDKEIIRRYCNNLADYLGCDTNKTDTEKMLFLSDRKDLDKYMIS